MNSQLAKVAVIAKRADGSWAVPSMSGNGKYTVTLDGDKPSCTCPDCDNGFKCKHIFAVEFSMERQTTQHADGSVTVTEKVTIKATKRTTYKQDWPNYNAAQTNEGDVFLRLLTDVCDRLPDLPPKSPHQQLVGISHHLNSVYLHLAQCLACHLRNHSVWHE